jgi:hypothetical protein
MKEHKNYVVNTETLAEQNPGFIVAEQLLTQRAIEGSEERGQSQFVESDVLPATFRSRAYAEKIGFVFHGPVEGDPIFVYADLPKGWRKIAGEESRHSYIVDEQGRRRVHVFYKAAYYDRHAEASFCARFELVHVEVTPYAYPSPEADRYCVKDNKLDKVIFRPKCATRQASYNACAEWMQTRPEDSYAPDRWDEE